MKTVRAFGATVLLASGLFATSQGCALFTCIEDCDSATSSGGGGGVGGSGAPTASASITTTNVTSTGAGGEGGSAPCTDCPICSAELDGPALSVAVLADNAYVLVELPGQSEVFELAIEPGGGFGDPSPVPSGAHPMGGRLVGTTTTVFHVTENLFQDVFSGEACDTSHTLIGAAAAGSDVFFLTPDGLLTFTNCIESIPDGDFAGAPSIAASLGRIAFPGAGPQTGPCFKQLPLVLTTPAECLAGQKPLAVALIPSGKRILFRESGQVYSWEADSSAPVELITDFGGDEEAGLPIAATTTEVFFARSTATRTMWRCTIDPPYECRSAETEAVSSIHVDRVGDTAYFTMGSRVCKWP